MYSVSSIPFASLTNFTSQPGEQLTSQFSIPNSFSAKHNETYMCSRNDSNAFEPASTGFCTNIKPSLPFNTATDYLTSTKVSGTTYENQQAFTVPSNLNWCNDNHKAPFHSSSSHSYIPSMSANYNSTNSFQSNHNSSSSSYHSVIGPKQNLLYPKILQAYILLNNNYLVKYRNHLLVIRKNSIHGY